MSYDNVQFPNPKTGNKTIKTPFGITINDSFNEQVQENTITISPEQKRSNTALQNPFGARGNEQDSELIGNISLGENRKAPQIDSFSKNYGGNQQVQTGSPGNYSGYGSSYGGSYSGNPDDLNEPPLLEDLGIDLENIKTKTLAVLTLKKCDDKFLDEADMSGPLLLALAFGGFLLLSGKVHFGYIYGFGALGCISIYMLMNLLSQDRRVQLYNAVSILGYCLLPIVILSAFNVPIDLRNFFGFLLSLAAIGWATITATNFFEAVLKLNEQKWLVAYPIFLFYLVFVLITIF